MRTAALLSMGKLLPSIELDEAKKMMTVCGKVGALHRPLPGLRARRGGGGGEISSGNAADSAVGDMMTHECTGRHVLLTPYSPAACAASKRSRSRAVAPECWAAPCRPARLAAWTPARWAQCQGFLGTLESPGLGANRRQCTIPCSDILFWKPRIGFLRCTTILGYAGPHCMAYR